ncbi:MAG: signal peptidase II [Thermoguttaceae bacterium]|nr:signal peptidase II [Thermoguttaceae bacterium]
MNSRSTAFRFFLFAVIAFLGVVSDLLTKNWIFHTIGFPGEQDIWWLIPDVFGFQTSLNQGALFGIGQGQTAFLVTSSMIAFVGIIWWLLADPTRSRFLAVIFGLVTAGILGNLWDRLGLHHLQWNEIAVITQQCSPDLVGQPIYAVRDWILVMLGDYPWPNFNLADSFLVCGAVLFGIYTFFPNLFSRNRLETNPVIPTPEKTPSPESKKQ